MPGVKPPAHLTLRKGDEELKLEELTQMSLFSGIDLARLKLEELPGTVVLRRFAAGEEICRQNDPGYTAFYPLTGKDLRELRESQLRASAQGGVPPERVKQWQEELRGLPTPAEGVAAQPVARAHRAAPAPRTPGLRGLFNRLLGKRTGAAGAGGSPGVILEGQVFGEMSCLYRTPRTATVVAERDCYMLELLRNVLDKMYGNKAFKEQMDRLYRHRVLELHLRAMPLFRDLSAEQFQLLRDKVELKEFEPGDVICAEHDRADGMFIIRSGFVKVVKGVSPLLGPDDVVDWPALCAGLHSGAQEGAEPGRKKLWSLLPAPARAAVERAAAAPDSLTADDRQEVLLALNELLKQPKLSAAAEFKALVEGKGWAAEAKKLPASPRKWSQFQQVCAFNRRLLEALVPDALLPLGPAMPTGRILDYSSEGEVIGEMGLLTGQPRSATCLAYDHYGEGKSINGRVEAVWLRKDLFEELRRSPGVDEHVTRLTEERRRSGSAAAARPVWDASVPALSARYEELSLIQGQKLMLIDLDRCTRCDKCVEACVGTHADGRSRLFLDGPRFQVQEGNRLKSYLVPATCRECQDPVCLVGCPVGSIHKGDNGQVVIEDWCIGCSRCAQQCPYGSIQMHAVGIIPRGARGWSHRRGGGPWAEGKAPFRHDRDLRQRYPGPEPIEFQYAFDLSARQQQESKSFHLQLQAPAGQPGVRVNGREVALGKPATGSDKGEKWNLEALLAPESGPGEGPLQRVLRPGRNEITVHLTPAVQNDELLFDLGLYAVARPSVPQSLADDLSQELVMNTAVVCDMCSEQFGQHPACVNACPHEAAMRVEARSFFPLPPPPGR